MEHTEHSSHQSVNHQPTKNCCQNNEKCGSVLSNLSPGLAFIAGVITTCGLVFAAGFIILLVMMAKGVQLTSDNETDDNTSNTNTATATATATPTPTVNANTAVAPKVTGKLDLADSSKIRGTGDITVVEFSDTECPFCKREHSVMQDMLKKYDGKVRWTYKHLPLEGLHQKSKHEAVAVECAAEQGKFWEYLDEVYAETNSNDSLDVGALDTIADKIELNRTKFDACLSAESTSAKVEADVAEADKLQISGTPALLVVDNDGNILAPIANSNGDYGAYPLEGALSISSFLDKYVK